MSIVWPLHGTLLRFTSQIHRDKIGTGKNVNSHGATKGDFFPCACFVVGEVKI